MTTQQLATMYVRRGNAFAIVLKYYENGVALPLSDITFANLQLRDQDNYKGNLIIDKRLGTGITIVDNVVTIEFSKEESMLLTRARPYYFDLHMYVDQEPITDVEGTIIPTLNISEYIT